MVKLALLGLLSVITCSGQVFSTEYFTEQNNECLSLQYADLKDYVKSQIGKESCNIKKQLNNIQREMANKYEKLLKENYGKNSTEYEFDQNIFNTKEYEYIIEEEINDILFRRVVDINKVQTWVKSHNTLSGQNNNDSLLQNTELKIYVKLQLDAMWDNILEQLNNIQKEMVNKYEKLLKEHYEENKTKYKFNKNIFNTKKYKDIVEDEINDIVFTMVVNKERAEMYKKRYFRRFIEQ